jgi:hypothetical protein
MLTFSTLRRAIAGATVTAGLLAAATPAMAAPVSFVSGNGAGAQLETFTLTTATGTTRTCTPVTDSPAAIFNNFGTPPTATFYTIIMNWDAYCLPNGGARLSLRGPMLGSVNAGAYTFTGPGFNATGSIPTDPSVPAPPVTGVWTNHAAPDGISRLTFNNVLISNSGVRLTTTLRFGTAFSPNSQLIPHP